TASEIWRGSMSLHVCTWGENHWTAEQYNSTVLTRFSHGPSSLQKLEAEGVKKFADSFDSLLSTLQGKVAQLV
ncbi:hypothetical protein EBR96_10645, partial [bacterium]|nr:hypothetical protein [bacterium]